VYATPPVPAFARDAGIQPRFIAARPASSRANAGISRRSRRALPAGSGALLANRCVMSRQCAWSVAAFAILLCPAAAASQELEPGAYWPLPRGLNVATAVNSYNWGDVTFEATAPIDEASSKINTTALSFTRAFNLAGRSANVGLAFPIVAGHIEGLYLGSPAEAERFGLGDPRVRLAMNVYGAPSMTPQQFGAYQLRTIVGVSLTTVMPLGEYDSSKLINVGLHRWSFKPEIGVAHGVGRWVVEVMAAVWFFTGNDEFLGTRLREQEPIVATQLHLTYRFSRSMWLAGNANFFRGGRTTIDGNQSIDFQNNSRIGVTLSKAFDRHQSIRVAVSTGAYTTIGNSFTQVAVGYNYAWVK
jgi:hypothetical protein